MSKSVMKNISVLVPTFHSKDLILILVKSFEVFKPEWLTVNYVVVENSSDVSYKQDILELVNDDSRVQFINNVTHLIGSEANANAIEIGLPHIKDQWVFICHCDTCVTSSLFFDQMLKLVEEGNRAIGTKIDESKYRIRAMHISGIFIESSLAKTINYYPKVVDNGCQIDVGDEITLKCRNKEIRHVCLDNTFNDISLVETLIKEKEYNLSLQEVLNIIELLAFVEKESIPQRVVLLTKGQKTHLFFRQ